MYMDEAALNPACYQECDWSKEQYSGGCFAGILPPGVMTRVGDAARKPFGLVHFAGSEAACEFYGYMEGAVGAGMRCAEEVCEAEGWIIDSSKHLCRDSTAIPSQ